MRGAAVFVYRLGSRASGCRSWRRWPAASRRRLLAPVDGRGLRRRRCPCRPEGPRRDRRRRSRGTRAPRRAPGGRDRARRAVTWRRCGEIHCRRSRRLRREGRARRGAAPPDPRRHGALGERAAARSRRASGGRGDAADLGWGGPVDRRRSRRPLVPGAAPAPGARRASMFSAARSSARRPRARADDPDRARPRRPRHRVFRSGRGSTATALRPTIRVVDRVVAVSEFSKREVSSSRRRSRPDRRRPNASSRSSATGKPRTTSTCLPSARSSRARTSRGSSRRPLARCRLRLSARPAGGRGRRREPRRLARPDRATKLAAAYRGARSLVFPSLTRASASRRSRRWRAVPRS